MANFILTVTGFVLNAEGFPDRESTRIFAQE